MTVLNIYRSLMTKHPRKTLAALLYPGVVAAGFGLAYLTGLPWWLGLIIAFGAMIVVGLTAG